MNKTSETKKTDSHMTAGPCSRKLRQDSPLLRNTASFAPKRPIPPDSIDCAGLG